MRAKMVLAGTILVFSGFCGGLVGGALFAAGQVRSQAKPETIETITARKFVLVDDDGVKRPELGTDLQGSNDLVFLRMTSEYNEQLLDLEADSVRIAQIKLLDEKGATFWANGQRSAIVLKNSSGKTLASLMGKHAGNGQSALTLSGGAGNDRVFLTGGPREASLTLSDHAGRSRAWLGDLSGQVSLTLSDGTGKERATLGNTDLKIASSVEFVAH